MEMTQQPIRSTPTISSTTKRQKSTEESESNHQPLLPGLPDHIAQLILSLVHHPSTLSSVCRPWRRLIYSPSFPPFLSLYALLLPTHQSQSQTQTQTHLSIFDNSRVQTSLRATHNPIEILTLDPISSSNWQPIPPPPAPPLGPILRHHPSFLSRNLPIQSVSVSGNLVLLAATADNLQPALPRPLVFDPVTRIWGFGPPISTPRRWCAAGTSGSAVFVASGIGSHYTPDVARSLEKWDLRKSSIHHRNNGKGWKWEKLESMRDGKFSREAIDAVGWRGKLCMVNVKGGSAKQGVIYEVATDDWSEMPEGMISGWRGPAAAMDEETLYAVDESKGVLREYDAGSDGWEEILWEERLRGAEQMAAAGGRVCVVCGGGGEILVVDVVAKPVRLLREVSVPVGFKAVAVHVLPRMNRPD